MQGIYMSRPCGNAYRRERRKGGWKAKMRTDDVSSSVSRPSVRWNSSRQLRRDTKVLTQQPPPSKPHRRSSTKEGKLHHHHTKVAKPKISTPTVAVNVSSRAFVGRSTHEINVPGTKSANSTSRPPKTFPPPQSGLAWGVPTALYMHELHIRTLNHCLRKPKI